jgi:hypothetical protein
MAETQRKKMSAKPQPKKQAGKKAPAKKIARKAAHAPKSKGGRPKSDVDPSLVEKLANINCPNTEIAAIVGCSVDTLTRRFAEVISKGREQCKTRLRQAQIKAALAGNVVMLIWLGKQMLGQSDKIDQKTEISGEVKQGNLSADEKKAVKSWVAQIQAEVRAKAGGDKE